MISGSNLRPKLDIEFKNLKFSVKDNKSNEGCRQILKSVNGKFSCGDLTAILGPSGAGKTTLLNALAGYMEDELQGSITVNGTPSDTSILRKMSAFITDDDITQPFLTVKEAMMYSACFKLRPDIKYRDKMALIEEIINLLGLKSCTESFSENLSGGEKKRLSIALELISDPPVIILDEPITGLDEFSAKKCIDVLKSISNLDRTVVFTIHQPSASLLQIFDQLYVLADGYCVYNGSPKQMVPFFETAGFICPSNYTPADFIIEMVHSQSDYVEKFTSTIQNGEINFRESCVGQKLEVDGRNFNLPISFWRQLYYLLSRMFLQMRRNRTTFYIQFFHHLLTGIIIGALFQQIGNDGSQSYNIAKFCASCVICIAYTYLMIPILLFPLEVKVMKKEYLNHWYSVKAYFCAIAISTVPLIVVLVTIFSTAAYFLTDQPQETNRFVGFCLIMIAIAYTSQSLGYVIGSICELTHGSVVGSAVLIPHIFMTIYGMDYKATIAPFYQFCMSVTYSRYGLIGLCGALFLEREPLDCKEIYCPYARGEILLKDISIPLVDYESQFCLILAFMVLFRIMGYVSLKCRLKPQLFLRLVNSIKMMFRIK